MIYCVMNIHFAESKGAVFSYNLYTPHCRFNDCICVHIMSNFDLMSYTQ